MNRIASRCISASNLVRGASFVRRYSSRRCDFDEKVVIDIVDNHINNKMAMIAKDCIFNHKIDDHDYDSIGEKPLISRSLFTSLIISSIVGCGILVYVKSSVNRLKNSNEMLKYEISNDIHDKLHDELRDDYYKKSHIDNIKKEINELTRSMNSLKMSSISVQGTNDLANTLEHTSLSQIIIPNTTIYSNTNSYLYKFEFNALLELFKVTYKSLIDDIQDRNRYEWDYDRDADDQRSFNDITDKSKDLKDLFDVIVYKIKNENISETKIRDLITVMIVAFIPLQLFYDKIEKKSKQKKYEKSKHFQNTRNFCKTRFETDIMFIKTLEDIIDKHSKKK